MGRIPLRRAPRGAWLAAALWLAAARPAAAATLATQNQTVTAPNGTALAIPVQADFAAGEHVLSLEIELDFPNNWFVTGIETAGTLLEGWGAAVDFHAEGDGLELAAAAPADMAGSGTLFRALVLIQGSGTLAIPHALLNQGSPVPVITQGYFTHNLPAAISISPNTAANLLPGETVQYNAGGNPPPLPPLTWSVENPASGQVSAGGLFTALAQGANRVHVSDSGGRTGAGPAIQVHTFHLQPAALSGVAGQERPLALNLQNPTGQAFHSLSFTLNLGSPRLTVTGLDTTGSLLAGWSELFFTQQGNVVTVAGAAPPEGGVNGAGLLLTLHVASSAGTAFNSTLTPGEARLDESWLTRTATAAASFTATNAFTLTPATATLLRGQTQQIGVSGTPNGPLTWTSLDPAVCSVSATGLVTALAGGDARLMALDPLGVGDTTGFYHVNDLVVAPANTTAPAGQVALVPLSTGDPAAFGITSWQLRLSHPTTWLTFDGLETAGSLCQGWSELGWTQQGGVIEAAGAGPALGAGTQLVFLRFLVAADAPQGGTATLSLQAFTYNEGLPTVQRGNGVLTVGALPPACQVTPTALDFGTVLPGTAVTRSFTITNTGGGTLAGTVSEGCAAFSIIAGAAYSLGAGQSQTVTVQFQSAAPGTFACTLDTGGACADVAATAAATAVAVTTGPQSACGVVDDLGHGPGATEGFLPDWNAGLVGLSLTPAPGAGVSVSVLVNGVVQYLGPAAASWHAVDYFDLTPWLGQDISLHFQVSDGTSTWNAGGSLCLWDLSFAAVEPGRPAAFALAEPAPNPFNPSTTLRWSLPQAGAARLALYDVQGRLARVLAEGEQAAGEHALRLEATGLASGLYLLRLEWGGQAACRRVLLLK